MTGSEPCWVECEANAEGKYRVHMRQDCVSLKSNPDIKLKKHNSRNEAALKYNGQVSECWTCKLNV